jgi:hypothetical protein
MKAPKSRSPIARLLTSTVVTSVTMLAVPFSAQSKDHADLQFWDMIWGGPEYIDTGKALVAQLNQEQALPQWRFSRSSFLTKNSLFQVFFCGMRTG